MKITLCSVSFAMLAGGLPTAALAQSDVQEVTDDQGIAAIVVTARKRQENLQDVPDSVSVISSQTILDAGITNVRDFAKLTPNVDFDQALSPAYSTLTSRGITTPQGAEAPMAIIVDGIQLPDLTFANVDLLNLERIEVIRGPQGALYGRNAIAGAINYVTKQPTNDFSGVIKAGYGNGDDRTLQGSISGPIVRDNLFFNVVGGYHKTDGLYENIYLNRPANPIDAKTVRTALFFEPDQNLRVVARFNYTDDTYGAAANEILTNAQINQQNSNVQFGTPLNQFRKLYEGSLKIDYDFGPVTLTSITARNRARQALVGDADFLPVAAVLQDVHINIDSFSEEVRLSSADDGWLRWLVGGYYQKRKTRNLLLIPRDDGTGQPDLTRPFIVNSRDNGRSKAYAFFGQATAELAESWELTLGLRYDSDARRSFDENNPVATYVTEKFDALQPKLSLMYKWADNFQTYATVARGFRSGGFNASTSVTSRIYDAETNWSYETGFKGEFLDRRLLISGAVFRIDMKNEQLYFVQANPPSQNITTIPKTQKTGVELEITARPVRDLDISVGIGTVDSVIKSWPSNPTTVGNKTYQSNGYNLSSSAQYRIHLTDELALRPYVSVEVRGPVYWDAINVVKTPALEVYNARLFLEGKNWSFGGFIKNIGDKIYPTKVGTSRNGNPDQNTRVPSSRRSYGIEAMFNF